MQRIQSVEVRIWDVIDRSIRIDRCSTIGRIHRDIGGDQRVIREVRVGVVHQNIDFDASGVLIAAGRVIDCQVTQSSGHADLDAATCTNVKRRARFDPAVRNGEKVQGSYSNRVRWQIPK